MTIKMLIEKMRINLDNGVYVILESKMLDIGKLDNLDFCRKLTVLDGFYNFMSGILWGLFSANFIDEIERGELLQEVFELSSI